MNTRSTFLVVLTIFVSIHYQVDARAPFRIVNGTTADEGEFPYMVQVRDSYGFFLCGGGIIGPKWILTAAHCVEDGISSIVYGTNKLYDPNSGHINTSVAVRHWHQHPKYSTDSEGIPSYDIGLLEYYPSLLVSDENVYKGAKNDSGGMLNGIRLSLVSSSFPVWERMMDEHVKGGTLEKDVMQFSMKMQLESPIPYSATAQPIQLAGANASVPFHVEGVLSGWGVNETYGYAEEALQKIYLPLLSDEECINKINSYSQTDGFNPIHHLCSDDYYNGECYGDSGSPFVVNNLVYGTVSWSYKPCGIVPGTYSRLTNPEYRDWVTSVSGI